MTILTPFHGQYTGAGAWRDEAGTGHAYAVSLTLEARAGGLGLAFRHVFHEEDNQPDVTLDLTLVPRASSILGADMGGLAVRGYWDDDTGVLGYAIPIPGNLVEATYVFDSDGTARVAGSSEKNAAGHFIMWTERLARV